MCSDYCFSLLEYFPSLLDFAGIRVLMRNFRKFSVFSVSCKNSARIFAAAILIRKIVDIFRKGVTSLKQNSYMLVQSQRYLSTFPFLYLSLLSVMLLALIYN